MLMDYIQVHYDVAAVYILDVENESWNFPGCPCRFDSCRSHHAKLVLTGLRENVDADPS